jgi:hypothetical protein
MERDERAKLEARGWSFVCFIANKSTGGGPIRNPDKSRPGLCHFHSIPILAFITSCSLCPGVYRSRVETRAGRTSVHFKSFQDLVGSGPEIPGCSATKLPGPSLSGRQVWTDCACAWDPSDAHGSKVLHPGVKVPVPWLVLHFAG